MKHAYDANCTCTRCTRERVRRDNQHRTTPQVMLDWTRSRTPRRRRIAEQYWDAYESGRPMSSDDY